MSRIATVIKEFHFEASHQLPDHKGKCANLHGHSYRVVVSVQGEIIDDPGESDDGMVIDFSDVKDVVKPIVDAMDHSFLCDASQFNLLTNTTNVLYHDKLVFGPRKIYNVGARTTAENIAWHIMSLLFDRIPDVFTVEVFETETSSACIFSRDFAHWKEQQN